MTQRTTTNWSRSLDKISYKELEQKIAYLKNADFAQLSMAEITDRIGDVIDQCPLPIQPLILSGAYRARKNKPTEVFTDVKDLWHPPSSVIKQFGRLNDIGQSRFYAANTSKAAMLELRPIEGDIITILIAKTKNGNWDTLDKILFIGDEEQYSKSNPVFVEDNYKKWLLVDNYLSSIIRKLVSDMYEYKPTIALANLIFANPSLDAINYPSVATNHNDVNICMLPDKADQYFQPSEAWMIKIHQNDTINGETMPRCQTIQRSRYITSEGFIEWMQEGEGLTLEAASVLFGNAKVELLSELPKPRR